MLKLVFRDCIIIYFNMHIIEVKSGIMCSSDSLVARKSKIYNAESLTAE